MTTRTSEDIITDVLGRAPDVQLGSSESDGWCLSRWRQFVGNYNLPALPDPVFTVHIAGKPQVKTWERDGWSETCSVPGCATLVPAGRETGWLVDGELDVVTLSISSTEVRRSPVATEWRRMRFGFADPLGVALTRQILSELYAGATEDRTAYVSALVNALRAHVLRGVPTAPAPEFPTSDFSAYRIHRVMNAVIQHPEAQYSVEELASLAGITPFHFSRVFRKATGQTPHQFVMETKLKHAQKLLAQSGMSLSTIADCLGFASPSHFTRAFRGFTGVPPSEFRRTGRGLLR